MKSVAHFLENDPLTRKARTLSDINACVQRHLPPPLDAHCRVGGCEDGVLFLCTDTGSAAPLIQCHGREVLKHVNAEFNAITGRLHKVSVRVTRDLRMP